MSQYRRCYLPGASYFFTVVTYNRRSIFSDSINVSHLKTAIKKVKKKYPFALDAIVVLPDHLHCLWQLPENDSDFSIRWQLIKRYLAMEIQAPVNQRKEKLVWQKRFWEHCIQNEEDWRKHMDYIHYNPVKHGLVKAPKAWWYSSFQYWVERGFYQENWGVEPILFKGMVESE